MDYERLQHKLWILSQQSLKSTQFKSSLKLSLLYNAGNLISGRIWLPLKSCLNPLK